MPKEGVLEEVEKENIWKEEGIKEGQAENPEISKEGRDDTPDGQEKEAVPGISVDIQIGTKDMFYFFMRHNYACFSGLFGLFISFGALILLAVRFSQYTMGAKCLLVLAGLLFTVIQPLQLLLKAANQIKRTPMFWEPIRYTFREDGLELSQKDQGGVIPWEEMMKIIDTGKYLIIYITRMRAYILPKNQIDHLEEIKEVIKAYANTANSP